MRAFLTSGLQRALGNGALDWLQPLPSESPLLRERAILEACQGRRVVHLGFVDEHQMAAKRSEGLWLHDRIATVASELVGLDVDVAGVEQARKLGFEAYAIDAQDRERVADLSIGPFETIVAGEIIEHLDAPGPFLEAMLDLAAPNSRLVLTTPNAYRLQNFLTPFSGNELIHPDHTAWHSPSTVKVLLERSGWRVDRIAFYQNPHGARGSGPLAFGLNLLRSLTTWFGQRWPYWSDGVIVFARPAASRH
jgi:SAM-dependent methyltransferase